MSESESSVGAETARVCERCDRESRHLTKWLDPDGSEHYVCWSCLQRTEKRVNLSQRWKRERRGDATAR
jgi:ribosome-binding protein aMBF1 (putative translation factor)